MQDLNGHFIVAICRQVAQFSPKRIVLFDTLLSSLTPAQVVSLIDGNCAVGAGETITRS